MKIRLLSIALVLLTSSSVFALPSADTTYSVSITNTTGEPLTTIIPTTTIRPKYDKLMGYVCMALNPGNTENFIGIFDGTDQQLSGENFAENEKSVDAATDFWINGKNIVSGVVVRQGANTQVQIYFKGE